MKTEIYVVTHKKYRFPSPSIYLPIVAGSAEYTEKQFPGKFLRDDIGDNISDKHSFYSEFTVTYWIWKNSHASIVGVNHYRRYFIKGGWIKYLICLLMPCKLAYKLIPTENDINRIFDKGYDCILPKKQWRIYHTVEEQYRRWHRGEVLDVAKEVVLKEHPEYYPAMINILNSKSNYQKCLCVMKKDCFDRYVSWLFSVCEKVADNLDDVKERDLAFLCERLMNVWIEYQRNNGMKIKEMFFVNVEFPLYKVKRRYDEYVLPRFLKYIFSFTDMIGIHLH